MLEVSWRDAKGLKTWTEAGKVTREGSTFVSIRPLRRLFCHCLISKTSLLRHHHQYPLIPPNPAASATSSALIKPTPSWTSVAQMAFLVAIGHAGWSQYLLSMLADKACSGWKIRRTEPKCPYS